MNKGELKDLLLVELARRNFWAFCLYVDKDFFSKRIFLKKVALAFQQIEDGTIKSLSVSMPPRAGKSYITSLFCAWSLGKNPKRSVMRNTCTATLYLKFSYDVRAIVKGDKFKAVFPTVKLSDDKANLNGWNTSESVQVGYFGAGVGGTIIGFGANNLAITDDLYRGIEDALSDTVNDRVLQWLESTHYSRLEKGCKLIDIGTRWAITDAIGRNIENKRYDRSIIIPALNSKGLTFCDEVATTEEYLTKQKYTAPEIWEAEYMQNPVDIKGRLFSDLNIIDVSEFNEIAESNKSEENPNGIEGAIAYIDVADAGKDYTAVAIAVVIKGTAYIRDYVYSRDNTDVTTPLIASKLDYWGVSYCRVESNSIGALFGRGLQKLTKARILLVANSVNKETRILLQSAEIMRKFTFVKDENDAQSVQFIQNVLGYSKDGKNKNDDAPDCLAGLSLLSTSLLKI